VIRVPVSLPVSCVSRLPPGVFLPVSGVFEPASVLYAILKIRREEVRDLAPALGARRCLRLG
jgi:hypothetical protein